MNKNLLAISAIGGLFLIPKILKPIIAMQEKRISNLKKRLEYSKKMQLIGMIKEDNNKIFYRTEKTEWTLICPVDNDDNNAGFILDFLVKKIDKYFYATIEKSFTRDQRASDGVDLRKIITNDIATDKKVRILTGNFWANALGLSFYDFEFLYHNIGFVVIHPLTGGLEILKNRPE